MYMTGNLWRNGGIYVEESKQKKWKEKESRKTAQPEKMDRVRNSAIVMLPDCQGYRQQD